MTAGTIPTLAGNDKVGSRRLDERQASKATAREPRQNSPEPVSLRLVANCKEPLRGGLVPSGAFGHDDGVPDLRPFDVMTLAACERLAADIRSGRLSVVKISLVDEDRFGFAVEALDLEGESTTPSTEPSTERSPTGAVVVAPGCPDCGSGDVRDVGRGERVCLKCNKNWTPPGATKKE